MSFFMSSSPSTDERTRDAALRSDRVDELVECARAYVHEAKLPSVQLALGYRGGIIREVAIGCATVDGSTIDIDTNTLFVAWSTTKAVVSSAAWLLLQDRRIELDQSVVQWIPEFAENGKAGVTVEHLLTHTGGFPNAPFDPMHWDDARKRAERFASWRLTSEPGLRFEYHATSAMWVMAEILERACGTDFRRFVREQVLDAAGVDGFYLGLPRSEEKRVADFCHVGVRPSPDAGIKLKVPLGSEKEEQVLLRFNDFSYRQVGVPGGGGITTARALATFYQRLLLAGWPRLANNERATRPSLPWRADTVRRATRIRTGGLKDPTTGRIANRGLGVVVSGGDDRLFRSFGATNSPLAFGHAGVGGQIGWGDPETGLSFAFLTNGLERNPLELGGRVAKLSSLAAACVETSEAGS